MKEYIREYIEISDAYKQDFVYDVPEDLSNFADMPEFARIGYIFKGWSLNRDSNEVDFHNTQEIVNLTTDDLATIDVYAVWEKDNYVIQYNPNGAANGVYYQSALYDSDFQLDSNKFISPDGYYFLGWTTYEHLSKFENITEDNKEQLKQYLYTDNEIILSSDHSSLAPSVFNGDVANLFAIFSRINIFARNNKNQKELIDDNIPKSKLEKNAITHNLSIQYNSNCDPGISYTDVITGDNFNTVDYRVQQYSKNNFNTLRSVENGKYPNYPKILGSWSAHPIDKNKLFKENTLISDLITNGIITPVNNLINIYAFWSLPYYIKFNGVSPNNNISISGDMELQTCAIDVPEILNKNLFKLNWHTFKGWTSNIDFQELEYIDEAVVSNIVDANETINLYTLWDNTYKINYHFNSNVCCDVFTYDVYKELSDGNDIFENDGYSCIGWTDINNPNIILYQNNEQVKNISEIDGDHCDLSAKWASVFYLIFNKNDDDAYDDITMDNQKFIYGFPANISLNKFKHSSKVFNGWKGSNGKTYTDGELISNLTNEAGAKIELCALWGEYRVEYRYDEAKSEAYLCATYGNPQKIDIPQTVDKQGKTYTVVGIDSNAFYNFTILDQLNRPYVKCTNLVKVEMPSTLVMIDSYAFADLCNLYDVNTLSNTQLSIYNNGVFQNCSSLSNIYSPDTVRVIEKNAFRNCINLKNFANFDNLLSVNNQAFKSTSIDLTYNDFINIEYIGNNAFDNCNNITGLNLNNCKFISNKAFDNCSKISNIYIGTEVDVSEHNLGNVFSFYTDALEIFKIDIDNKNIKIISEYLFSNNSNLSVVELNNSMLSILNNAFENCNNLLSIYIPSNVNYIGDNAFYDASSLYEIDVDDNNPYYYDISGVLYKYEHDYNIDDIIIALDNLNTDLSNISELI